MIIKKCLYNIYLDLKALRRNYKLSYLRAFISNRGFHSLLFYRLSNCLYKLKIPIIPLILTRIIQIIYGIDIDYRAEIEGGVIIIHGIGTVIGQGAVIKKGCIIYHQVTLGIKGSSKNDGFPIIGENVVLGAGSKILGKVKIGNNCIIGANTVITTNIPENNLVKLSKSCIEIKTLKK